MILTKTKNSGDDDRCFCKAGPGAKIAAPRFQLSKESQDVVYIRSSPAAHKNTLQLQKAAAQAAQLIRILCSCSSCSAHKNTYNSFHCSSETPGTEFVWQLLSKNYDFHPMRFFGKLISSHTKLSICECQNLLVYKLVFINK